MSERELINGTLKRDVKWKEVYKCHQFLGHNPHSRG
jgi:hypothetical protein